MIFLKIYLTFFRKINKKKNFIGEEVDEEESVSDAGQDEEEEEDIPDEQTFLTREITMEDIKRYMFFRCQSPKYENGF